MIKTIGLLSTGSLALSGVTLAAGDVGAIPGIQYGALGLCFIVVGFLLKYLWSVTKKKDDITDKLAELTEKNTIAYMRLIDTLNDRPCLHGHTDR